VNGTVGMNRIAVLGFRLHGWRAVWFALHTPFAVEFQSALSCVLARHYDLLLYMEDELCLSCAQMAALRL